MTAPQRATRSRLTAADYDSILGFVHTVAEIDSPGQFAEIVADHIGDLVGSDVTSLNDVDPSTATLRSVLSPRSFAIAPSVVRALAELADQHPLIAHMSTSGDGSAIKISDFWTRDQWAASELYERVYAPMGVEHQIAIALPTRQPAVVGLALNRTSTRVDADFDERDRAVLNRVRPHLAQSWRNATEHARLVGLLAATREVLTGQDASVLLLADPIHELTPGTLTNLYRYYGRPSAHTPLPARVQVWLDQQRSHHRHGGLDALAKPLATNRNGLRMMLRYLPGNARHDEALLVSVTPEPDLPREFATLGLTPRETEILSALTTGATNAAIAQALHLSPATIKNHLEHIYRKLGAHTRSQATAIALTMLGSGPGGP